MIGVQTSGNSIELKYVISANAGTAYLRDGMGNVKQPKRQKPQRSCIACRRKMDKQQLTRIVNTPENGIVVDRTGKQNGRGAYLCNQLSCWDKINSNTRLLDQALKTKVTTDDINAIVTHKPATSGGDGRP